MSYLEQPSILNLPVMLSVTGNLFTSVRWHNQSAEQEIGYSVNMLDTEDFGFRAIVHPDDFQLLLEVGRLVKSRKRHFNTFIRLTDQLEDNWCWCLTTVAPHSTGRSGTVEELLCLLIKWNNFIGAQDRIPSMLQQLQQTEHAGLLALLTKREKEVLNCLGKGKSLKDACRLMYISYNTLNTHIKKIKRKLNIDHTSELIAFAQKTGV